MLKENFTSWILRQVERQDAVGDLARDYQADTLQRQEAKKRAWCYGGSDGEATFANGANCSRPLPASNDFAAWHAYLSGTAAVGALQAAFVEWNT